MRVIALFLVAVVGTFSLVSNAAELSGQVVSVADGDTLTILVYKKQIKIRLAAIDAPESKQPFGSRSKQSLSEICFGKGAVIYESGNDRYGRTIGTVICEGVDANAEQVRRGMAWVYERYAPKNSPLFQIEQMARNQKIGLWAMKSPTPPWHWRQVSARPAD